VRTLLEAGMDPMLCDSEGRSVFQAVWEVEGEGEDAESVEDPAVATLVDVFAQGIFARGAGKGHTRLRDGEGEGEGERQEKRQRV
jgi:hypothetical protein